MNRAGIACKTGPNWENRAGIGCCTIANCVEMCREAPEVIGGQNASTKVARLGGGGPGKRIGMGCRITSISGGKTSGIAPEVDGWLEDVVGAVRTVEDGPGSRRGLKGN